MKILSFCYKFFDFNNEYKKISKSFTVEGEKNKCQIILHYLDTPHHHQALGHAANR
jgi:hypothetical protein